MPLKIETGIIFQIFSSAPCSTTFVGFVCPKPLPNEHSPILRESAPRCQLSNNVTHMSSATLCRSSMRSMTGPWGPASLLERTPSYLQIRSLMLLEKNVSSLSTALTVKAGERKRFRRLWGSGRLLLVRH